MTKASKLLLMAIFLLGCLSAAVWAASAYYNNINCQTANSANECSDNEGRYLSGDLRQIAFELNSGDYTEKCDGSGQFASCNLAGVNLSCSNNSGQYYCQDSSESFHIDCDTNNKTCYAQVTNPSLCKQTPDTEAICSTVLPPQQVCQLGLLGCTQKTNPESPQTVFKQLINNICADTNNTICDTLQGPDGDTIIVAITPENLDLANDSSQATQSQLFNYISQHLQQVREGSHIANFAGTQKPQYFDQQQGFYANQIYAAANQQQTDAINDELDAIINLSQDGRLSMYVNASFLSARQDLSELEGKSKSQVAMLTTGLDYRLSQGVVGGALSYADGSTEYGKNDSEFDSANYNATVYGSFYKKQWWLDGALNYGLSRFNQERDIFCTAASCSQISNTYYADYNGSTLSGQIASGYDFIWGGFSLSPFAQWQLGKVKTDSYSEKAEFSGPTATIAIDEQERDFSTASLGSYLRYSIATKKAVLVPYLRVVFNHELKDDAQYISGRLVGAANSDFVVRANDRDNNYATIGTGLSFQMQNGNAGFIDVETVEAYDNLSQYQLTGGWRFVF